MADTTSAEPRDQSLGGERPRLADGVELIGEQAGSGYREPPALARRGDGQMVQLTPLLYLVADAADGKRSLADIAEQVSGAYGKAVSADNVQSLVEKLRPLGILAEADGTSPARDKPDPLLALRFRRAVIPEHLTERVAAPFKPLFWPPVVLAALAGLVAFDIWLFIDHGVAQGFRQALYEPALLLLVFGLVIASAAWHEFGHAAGCAYGGARPGAMGAGVYIAFPAFYTDVTDAYRLSRAGRLRTDLAGVYFNGLFILAMAGLYWVTGFEALLLVILFQHIEAAHQLLPFLRLDGYYVVADLTGVPDLFARIKPILAGLAFWRPSDPRVTQLKPWVRMVVTTWVFAVIPLLLFQLGMILLHLPRIAATAWDSLGKQVDTIGSGAGDGNVIEVLSGVLQAAVVALPLLGIGYTLVRLAQRLVTGAWRATQGRPVSRTLVTAGCAAVIGGLACVWAPNGDYERIHRGERGTLGEGIAAIREVGTGRSSLVSRNRAEARGALEIENEDEGASDPADDPHATTTTVEDESRESDATTTTADPDSSSGSGRGEEPATGDGFPDYRPGG